MLVLHINACPMWTRQNGVVSCIATTAEVIMRCYCWLDGQEPESTDEDESTEPEPPHHHYDEKRMHIGEQTDKEVIQNFLRGDFCVHGVSLLRVL